MDLDDKVRLAALRRTNLAPSPDEAFDRFARMVQRQLGVAVALVSLVDDHRQFFPGQIGLPSPWSEQRETPLSHSFCQQVVTGERALVVSDARTDPRVSSNLAIADLGVVGYAGFPIRGANGVVLGSLCAITHTPHVWTQLELDFMADLAQCCSSELRLRTTAAAAQTAGARIALLAEVTQAVMSTLDVDELIGRLARVLVPSMGDWVSAAVVDEAGQVRTRAVRHRDESMAAATERLAALQVRMLAPDSVAGTVLRTGEASVVSRAEVRRRASAAEEGFVDEVGSESLLVLPLRARARPVGYVTLGRGPERPSFGESDIYDALDIGRRAGAALENAELFRTEQQANLTMQRSMLTRLPEPDGLELVARYVPAADSAQVGGDWYDAFVRADGTTSLVVGDVTGHDIAAAAMMGQLRNILRGVAFDGTDGPAATLSQVDRTLAGLKVSTLATAVLATVRESPGGQALTWSNAGHLPPVLLAADGSVRLLETASDLLLGLDPRTPRGEHVEVLQPGDTVLLYTDGLVERRDTPFETGLLRLRDMLGGKAGLALDDLCDEVLAQMTPQRAEDDVAIVAVRVSR